MARWRTTSTTTRAATTSTSTPPTSRAERSAVSCSASGAEALNARLSIADAQREWSPSRIYLNTASYGLPPAAAWEALQEALSEWRGGHTSWEHWAEATTGARAAFAAMVGVEPGRVAVGATVSGLVGLVASSLASGTRVLVPEVEFTSTLFPFLVQPELSVRLVPAGELAESIDERTDVVAFSAVQMSTGAVADLDAIASAAAACDALTLVDVTQAAGWLPLDAGRFDFVVAAAYKWLMSPRGTAFMTVDPSRLERVLPAAAGWYAGEDVHASYFGAPLRLAGDARRLDTSPAWFSWVGTQPALELINRIGVEAIHEHDLRLANRFRAGLGLPPGDSAIVSADHPDAEAKLAAAGIGAAMRGGRLRTSWHVYNTDADVDAALEAISP